MDNLRYIVCQRVEENNNTESKVQKFSGFQDVQHLQPRNQLNKHILQIHFMYKHILQL